MSTVESFLANGYESSLTSQTDPSGLTFNVTTTVGGPEVPCWLVVDPDDILKREYFYAESKTGTSYTCSDIGKRYGTGSAAGSGLTHSAGAVVRSAPTQQHFEEIWDRLGELAAISHDEDHAVRHASGGADSLTQYYIPKGGGTFTGQVVVSAGGLNITGNSTFTGSITATGDVTADDLNATSLIASGNIQGATLNTTGLATLNSLTVSGQATMNANATVAGDLTVNNDLTVADVLTVNGSIIGEHVIPFRARAYKSSSQAITNSSDTKVTFNTEEYDVGGVFDIGTERFEPSKDGIYDLEFHVAWEGNANGTRRIQLRKNGSIIIADDTFQVLTSATIGQTVKTTAFLDNADYVECWVFQTSGGNLNLEAGNVHPGTWFVGTYIGK